MNDVKKKDQRYLNKFYIDTDKKKFVRSTLRKMPLVTRNFTSMSVLVESKQTD